MANVVPFWEGIFEEDALGDRLLGNKCKSCGKIYFPKAQFCFNCFDKEMEEVGLSRCGKLYSYTIGRMASTHFQPPYAVGLIDLPEEVRVFAPLKMTKDETYRIGMEMEVVIEELWREEDKKVIGYKFKPV
jgi:uncharacterized OB-fold protein